MYGGVRLITQQRCIQLLGENPLDADFVDGIDQVNISRTLNRNDFARLPGGLQFLCDSISLP